MYIDSFIYAELIDIVKENFKDYFLDAKDLSQNTAGQINRKKGCKKKTLSQGAYEWENGFFGLKFDSQLGVRNSLMVKDKTKILQCNINKSNQFWWLVSKVYLNKYHLLDAKDTVDKFFNKMKLTNGLMHNLFTNKWVNFEELIKDDPELEGFNISDVESKPIPQFDPLMIDDLWWDDFKEDNALPTKPEINRYAAKLDNASETDIKYLLSIIDNKFQIDSRERVIGNNMVFRSNPFSLALKWQNVCNSSWLKLSI